MGQKVLIEALLSSFKNKITFPISIRGKLPSAQRELSAIAGDTVDPGPSRAVLGPEDSKKY